MNMASHFVGAGGAVILALIAFSIVFLVLIGLSFVIIGNKYLANTMNSRQRAQSAPAAPKPSMPAQAVAAGVSQGGEDENLVAVLTAAVAAVVGGGVTVTGVRPALAVSRQARATGGWRSFARTCNLEGSGV